VGSIGLRAVFVHRGHHILTRAAGCLLVLVMCSPAQSSGIMSDRCPEPIRKLRPSEFANLARPESDLMKAGYRSSSEKRMGPLTVSATNPRYFADASGRAVYLAGAHTWNNLVDMGSQFPPRSFNFDAYLDFLKAHNHNLIRLWAWEVTRPNDGLDTPLRKFAAPQPWRRTGPGVDINGLPKFDLTQLDHSYFQRLRNRVEAARKRGIYVIIMLFEGWSAQFSPGRLSHPFYAANNINDTQYVTDLRDIYTLRYPQITRLQQNYLQAVINAVNDLDNVLFEIANEAGSYSTAWQYAMLHFVKCYESTKPSQHPVGITYQYSGGSNSTLFDSEADWIAPGPERGNYLTRPDTATGLKVVISDSDHLEGSSLSDPLWVYKSFFRGLNTLYMDRYVGPDALNPDEGPSAPEIRAAMGQVRLIATLFDMSDITPVPNLATTGYALQGKAGILILTPDSRSRFNVDLGTMPGMVRLQWFDTVTGEVREGGTINGGKTVLLQSPMFGAAVLYASSASPSGVSLSNIQEKAQAIRQASMTYAPWLIRLRLMGIPYLDILVNSYRALVLSLFTCVAAGVALGFTVGLYSASSSSISRIRKHGL